jgi:hypothetical protein
VILDADAGSGYKRLVVYDGMLLLAATGCVVAVRVFDGLEKGWRGWA